MIKMLAPFTIVFQECKSGHWLAWYQKRSDIIANGDTKKECENNLVEMYKWVMEYEKFETLKDDLCLGCGEPKAQGIMGIISHGCPINTVNYYPAARFSMRKFGEMLRGKTTITLLFGELLQFEHFKPMPDFDTATWIDKNHYLLARQSDIRTMKRLRAYIELEEELDSKY